ncbi:Kelch repeat-containing protein [Archangium violaceum]|uniref:Kelch repeat-containing protein n=1 Tax=Archangium violaceum TaxID=83451 RepID=UPI0023B780BA|nr:kelch repeat-containing protein [Archangium violaceum]
MYHKTSQILLCLVSVALSGCNSRPEEAVRPLGSLRQTQTLAECGAPGSLNNARHHHTVTVFEDGKVLVVGGVDSSGTPLSSAELYDPDTGCWTAAGSLSTARYDHTATLLSTGQVLISGGEADGYTDNTAELYDPTSPEGSRWTPTSSMNSARAGHTATLINEDEVLVVGGRAYGDDTDTLEIYDIESGTWTLLENIHLATPRSGHTATLLSEGRVVIMGGNSFYNNIASVELYAKDTSASQGTLTSLSPLSTARVGHTATLLSTGKVLVTGGRDALFNDLNSADLYDPNDLDVDDGAGGDGHDGSTVPAGGSTGTTMTYGRRGHTATELPDGRILVLGGIFQSIGTPTEYRNTAESYDPVEDRWSTLACTPADTARCMTQGRAWHTASLLPTKGKVLISGGFAGPDGALSSVELYTP